MVFFSSFSLSPWTVFMFLHQAILQHERVHNKKMWLTQFICITGHMLIAPSYRHWFSPFKAGELSHALQWPNLREQVRDCQKTKCIKCLLNSRHLILTKSSKMSTVISPILQIKKLRTEKQKGMETGVKSWKPGQRIWQFTKTQLLYLFLLMMHYSNSWSLRDPLDEEKEKKKHFPNR